jgi:hypothetical protein
MPMLRHGWSAILLTLMTPQFLWGQFGDSSSPEQQPPKAQVSRWRTGMTVQAVGGPCQDLYGTLPVPTDWPEQKVRIVEEEISDEVQAVTYRMLENGVRQMLISIPRLDPQETASAVITFEIERYELPPPAALDELHIPTKPPSTVRKYLRPSPYIESRHREVRNLARSLVDDQATAWEQVERFYDHVRDNVTYRHGPLKGALRALRDGDGDCEELTSLFIALCRAHGVPARTVWVPGHCYPEFYLEDADGTGHWFACQAAGTRAFGSIPELRPILQKGDNFKVPEKKEPQRYVAEFLTGNSARGSGRPVVQFLRDELPATTKHTKQMEG